MASKTIDELLKASKDLELKRLERIEEEKKLKKAIAQEFESSISPEVQKELIARAVKVNEEVKEKTLIAQNKFKLAIEVYKKDKLAIKVLQGQAKEILSLANYSVTAGLPHVKTDIRAENGILSIVEGDKKFMIDYVKNPDWYTKTKEWLETIGYSKESGAGRSRLYKAGLAVKSVMFQPEAVKATKK